MNLGCRHCWKSYELCDCPASVARAEPIVALCDPEATIRSTAQATRWRLMRQICDTDRWNEIVDLAVKRATSIGAKQYGDKSYSKPAAALEREADEELADWLFYTGVLEERRA